jgi:photosystem II stability/assembly factor-like uncharacterized protein
MMKIIVVAFVFCCLVPLKLYSQPLWKQTSGPSADIINAIACDSVGRLYVAASNIYRSNDDGNTWVNLTGTISRDQFDPPYDKFNSVAVQRNGRLAATSANHIWVSSDGGASWALRLTHTGLSGIAVSADDKFIVAGTTIGASYCYTSVDGLNWDSVIYTHVFPGYGVAPVVYTSPYSGYSFILFSSDSATLYRSVDSCRTWSKVVNGLSGAGWATGITDAAGTLYMTTAHGGIYESHDNGRAWGSSSLRVDGYVVSNSEGKVFYDYKGYPVGAPKGLSPLSWSYQAAAAISPSGKLFAAYGSRVASFTSGIDSAWHLSTPPTSSPVSLLAIDTGIILGSTALFDSYCSSEMLSSLEEGNTQWTVNKYVQSTLRRLSIDSSGTVLAIGNAIEPGMGVSRSINSGETWSAGIVLSQNLSDLCVAPSGSVFAVSYGEGVFRSSDHGDTWDNEVSGIDDTHLLAIAVTLNGELFSASTTGFYHSTDDGFTWSKVTAPANGNPIHLVATIAGNIIAVVGNQGPFVSKDHGATWSSIGTELPSAVINDLLSTPGGNVFAATDKGVYYLPLNGLSWVNASNGLTATQALCLSRDKNGTVYVGMKNGGVFRSTTHYNTIQHAAVESSNQDFVHLSQQNEDLFISYEYAQPSPVRIAVENILGQTMTQSDFEAYGQNQYRISLAGLASGYYRLILADPHTVNVKNFVVTH